MCCCMLPRTPAYDAPELAQVRQQLERSREALSAIPIEEWKRHTNKTDTLKKVIPTIKQKVGRNDLRISGV